MGVYMGYTEITGMYKVIRHISFVRVGKIPKVEDRTGRVGRAGAYPQRTNVGCPKPSCVVCPTLTGPIFRYAHLVPKGPETILRKTLGHSICDIICCGYFLETNFP